MFGGKNKSSTFLIFKFVEEPRYLRRLTIFSYFYLFFKNKIFSRSFENQFNNSLSMTEVSVF